MKRMRVADRTLITVMALFLLAGCLALSLFPAKRLSERENRLLAEFPPFTAAGMADGSYTAALDTYATERFPARLPLRQARSAYQILTGRQEVGDVILCRDGSLSRRITVNTRALTQNLAAMQRIAAFAAESGLPLTVAVAPCRMDARADVLPALYDTAGTATARAQLRAALPETVTFSAITEDAHWYRTDHHWTSDGAFAAYCQLADALSLTPYSQSDFEPITVSESFCGTTHAAAGIPFIEPDSIRLYRYEGDGDLQVLLDESSAPFEGFYDLDKLSTYDQYAVFFGGNYGTLEITDGTDRPTLLVIKDSFANALLPFLARHYNILAVDPRYTTESLAAFATRADQALLLCGMQTLCESTVFRTLTAGI